MPSPLGNFFGLAGVGAKRHGDHPLNAALKPLWALAAATAHAIAACTRTAPTRDLNAAGGATPNLDDARGKLSRTFALRHGVRTRLRNSAARRDPTRPLIWLHAPSVGEGLQARPILQALRRSHPNAQLAYTFFSPSAQRFAERLQSEGLADFTDVLPFDRATDARLLLDAWQPALLTFVKLDVWPVLAEMAQARGIPTALVSATLAPNSGRQHWLARAALSDAYRGLSAVGAISADDAARLTTLGVRPDRITITGDTRMDQVAARTAAVGPEHPVRQLGADAGVTLVAGSTWPADEAVLLPAVTEWLSANPTTRFIIAPHEPTPVHLDAIARWAAEVALATSTLSAAESDPDRAWRILLVDRVGVLGDLYALADIAYVGGGFHNAGLHSVLEPAAFGVPVLFGPRHVNAREAGELVARGGAFVDSDASALGARLAELSVHTTARREAGAHALSLVTENLGSTTRVVAVLDGLLNGLLAAAESPRA